MIRPPLTYLISDGSTKNVESSPLVRLVQAAVESGIDFVQIREKQLPGAQLYGLTSRILAITSGSNTKVLVNDRVDVALAAGADGVHLTESSIPVDLVRRRFGRRLLIGVSTHTLDGVTAADRGGADLMVFGPVFLTASKPDLRNPAGVARLKKAINAAGATPVLALGGIDLGNAKECMAAGAAGLAGINLFRDPARLRDVVAKLRSY